MRVFSINSTYILHEKLGQGGMGTVYRATHRLSGVVVALKRVNSSRTSGDRASGSPVSSSDQILRATLAQEYSILASLHHPHIVRVIDYGFDEEQRQFFTMELLEAPRSILVAGVGLPAADKVELITQLLRALAYLHHRRILHRDIKPSNVMVARGEVKLLDFGIAGTVETLKHIAGTVEYMAPELFLGQPASPASDLYAVGILAFELLTGRFPYDMGSVTTFLSQLLGERADDTMAPQVAQLVAQRMAHLDRTRPDVASLDELLGEVDRSGRVAKVLARLIARAPEERYADAAEVIRDLSTALDRPFLIETTATRESYLQAAEFVGRERELGELDAALARTLDGAGSLLLIAGESGVGKSRLLSELRTRALVRCAQVARGQALSEGGASYQLWAPILRALCLDAEISDLDVAILSDAAPDLTVLLERPVEPPPPLPPHAARARLHAAVARLIKGQRAPWVILIEDLHWAGSESVELLGHLGALLTEVPVLVVGTYRESEAHVALQELAVGHRLRLDRLGTEGIAALSAALLGPGGRRPEIVEYLRRHTEGNVLFVIEVVRALAELSGERERIGEVDLPEQLLTGGIERLIQRHLEPLSPADRALLELAAVAGHVIDRRVLQHASGVPDLLPWLQRGANAAVIEARQEEWLFGHNKIREWLLTNLAAGRLRELHERVAESLAIVHAGDPSYDAALAFHYGRAGHAELAYRHALAAGQSAARLYAFLAARAHYRSALAALGQLADTPDNRRRRIDATLLLVSASTWGESLELLMSQLGECLDLLLPLSEGAESSLPDLRRLARTYYLLGRCRYSHGDIELALEMTRRSREVAQRAGEDAQAAACLGLIGHLIFIQGRIRESITCLTRAQEEVMRTTAIPERARTVASLGTALVAQGQVQRGFALIEESRQLAVEGSFQPAYLQFLCQSLRMCQAWEELEHAAAACLALVRSAGDGIQASLALFSLARATAELGRPEAATEHVRQAFELLGSSGSMLYRDLCLATQAEVALARGDAAAALDAAEQACAQATSSGSLFGQGIAQRVCGRALAAARPPRRGEARTRFATSLQRLDEGEIWIEGAATRIEWAELALAEGDPIEAGRLVEPALALFTEAGLERPRARAQALLDQTGALRR